MKLKGGGGGGGSGFCVTMTLNCCQFVKAPNRLWPRARARVYHSMQAESVQPQNPSPSLDQAIVKGFV